MTEAEWLASTEPAAMLRHLTHERHEAPGLAVDDHPRSRPLISDRKLRLFACACCRQAWHLLTDARSRRAVEVAERWADLPPERQRQTRGTLERAYVDAWDGTISPAPADQPAHMACVAAVTFDPAPRMGVMLAWETPSALARRPAQAALLRDIVGDPWRKPTCGWRTVRAASDVSAARESRAAEESVWWGDWCVSGTVIRLAEVIYQERAFERLPVLADALEDAGCDDAALLAHLRGPGPHARGCFAVDCLLGKE